MTSLTLENIGISFGGLRALDGVSFTANSGEVTSIIGPNGAGKTTLFNIITGIYQPDIGKVLIDGTDVTGEAPHDLARRGMARTFQNLQIFEQMSALDNVMAGRHLHERRNVLADMFGLPSSRKCNRESAIAAQAALKRVGLGGVANRPAGDLSYGQLKRLEIARALTTEASLILFDEPAAGCNAVESREIDDLISSIASDGAAVILIEHDMRMVMRISSHIIVLDHGRKIAEGTPETVRKSPQVVEAYLGVHGAKEAGAALA
ncbi:MAG: high-affinity branched-chain amino acid ABC transporter ATP-binding protein LivG [Hyphomicrobiales bacterium]|nr:MAG: high-affinity branched-chain amino acid ABC transporter ATP-binding protein LivG [Hyphomicrobiales bacterium]